MQTNLYIPDQIHVGFQKREDTFTGKLGYVTFQDKKGILRQEKSWEGWRHSSIEPLTFDNVPSRFVLNKGVQRHGHFGSGRSVIRVYDNRDFEFEISIDNLIGILMHSDVSKRDIIEECVFAWEGKNLVLLPINSEEYRTSIEFTQKQEKSFSSKNLIKGHVYEQKNNDEQLIYIGYDHFYDYNDYSHQQKYMGKKHIFYNLDNQTFVVPSIQQLAQVVLSEVHQFFAELISKFYSSIHAYEMKQLMIQHNPKYKAYTNHRYHFMKPYYLKKNDSEFYEFHVYKRGNEPFNNSIRLLQLKKNDKYTFVSSQNIESSDLNQIFNKIGLDWCFRAYTQEEAIQKWGAWALFKNDLGKNLVGKNYSEAELTDLLLKAGFVNQMFMENEKGQLFQVKY